MKNNVNKVLKACIELVSKGGRCLNVFDLMYETSLAYPELKDMLDKLVLKNELEVIDLKTYKFIGDINRKFEEAKTQKPVFENVEYSSGRDAALEARRTYLEERRKELIARMQAEEEAKKNDEIDEDELRYKALKLCIEKGQVSVSFLQRSFPIGYIKSCELVDWMENMGYISAAEGVKPREVLITFDEFNRIFNETDCEEVLYHEAEENDEDEELDEKFAEYEKYLQGELDGLENDDLPDSEEPNGQERLIEFLKELLREGRINKSWEEIPEHLSWDNDNDFMRGCSEKLIEIANSDKKMGRQGALKKAKVILEEARKVQSKKMIEVYECIVFELQNMSNYYYIKIREGLL